MKILNVMFMSTACLCLTACVGARYSTKKNNYIKQSKTVSPMVVPNGAIGPRQKPYYAIPASSVATSNAAPSLKPPGLE